MMHWQPAETSTHQDHVIAHVIGTSVLGYFVHDESLHLLLDIGFIWTIYLDGQMVLLPQTAAISELAVDASTRQQINAETTALEQQSEAEVSYFTAAPVECRITEVQFFASEEARRFILAGETDNLVIDTSLTTGEIHVRSSN